MKKLILIILIINYASIIHAQINLIMNPSFEKYSQCPWYNNQIQFAYYWSPMDSTANPDTPWNEPMCAPDLIAECSDTNIAQ